jgi:hypothetical protein
MGQFSFLLWSHLRLVGSVCIGSGAVTIAEVCDEVGKWHVSGVREAVPGVEGFSCRAVFEVDQGCA